MERRPAVIGLALVLTVLAGLLLVGHGPWSGPAIVALDGSHGVHGGDLVVMPLWAAGIGCCVWWWRR